MRAVITVVGAVAVAAAALALPGTAAVRETTLVELAVIDTGADLSSPALRGRHPLTYDVLTHRTNVQDVNGHGTLVASIAAAASGDARLLIIKAGSSSGAFSDANEATAIRYAVDHGAKVINVSIGGPTTSRTERSAVAYAIAHGVLLVAPAGNGYGTTATYPAALLGNAGLAVAASTQSGAHAAFSNSGPWVSIAAPGENGSASGTSLAAPLVAGAAALVWSVRPSLTARQVVSILEETASGDGMWSPELGWGVVDVAAALARAHEVR